MSKRSVAIDDFTKFKLAGAAQISPEGRWIVFTIKLTDTEKNQYYTSLWIADGEAGELRPFTGDRHGDSSPRWSPDGNRIAFLSDREKPKSQIYVIPTDGGEARALTSLDEGGIQSPVWSPDGKRIAFLHRATPEQYREKAKKEREENCASAPVRVHTKLFYRLDGLGYWDDSFWQVWVADAETGEAKPLTDAPYNHGALAWSPDGKTLAFVANAREDNDLEDHYDDLWTVPADGGEIRRIEAPDGPKHGPAWSPDGKWIAYVGHTDLEDTWGGRNPRVLVIPAGGSKEARDLTGESDMAVGYLTLSDAHEPGDGNPIVWSPDSRVLYFPMSHHGDTRLYRVSLEGGDLQPLTPEDHEMGAFSLSREGDRLGIMLGNAVELHDIYLGTPEGEGLNLNRLTHLNQDLLNEVEMQMPEPFTLTNGEGGMVEGWILRPPGYDEKQKYPCVLYVHGGPALQYGGQSSPFHELQWLAAEGYVVLFPNPRGSKGYGEAHTKAIKGDWGNRDWEDIQAVADYGAALPYVDSDRMAIMGGSYGGYMTAWAVGHTDRFKCAITDRLVGNLHSFSGTCDFSFTHEKYFGGNAWDDPSELWRVSPLAYAGRINTPLLIIHSDGDLRCPVGQAEELFAALRNQRKTVEFVRYPSSASHGMSRNGPPDLRLDRLRRNKEWLDRYLKPETEPHPS
ncbi:MAG: S9 family peptidase [Armatimonadetes bacterium]|nr:S9 family peptidase [Armatimonadota bacterium]